MSSDRPTDRRDLWHVTRQFVDVDGSSRLDERWDGTHTLRQYYLHEDVLADFVPAGWCWPVGAKPLYYLTRRCGADDPADLLTDGGFHTPHHVRTYGGMGDQSTTCEHGTVGCLGEGPIDVLCFDCFIGGESA